MKLVDMGGANSILVLTVLLAIFYFVDISHESEYHRRHRRDDGSMLADSGGPVAQSNRAEDADIVDVITCSWTIYPKQVLSEVLFETMRRNQFKILPVHEPEGCNSPVACKEKCESLGCNYFVFDSASNEAYFYEVNEKIIQEGKVDKSSKYDSFIINCKPKDTVDHGCPDCELRALFRQFIRKYKKQYASDEEFEGRFKTFKGSIGNIVDLNRLRTNENEASFGITQFSDADGKEFLESFTGALDMPIEKGDGKLKQVHMGLDQKCASWDWTKMGVIPPVRDQGKCGCCYAFSSSDLLASQYHIDRKLWNKTATLSPQFIVDCLSDPAAFGCKGGRAVKVLQNLINQSLPNEDCYPYKIKEGKCESAKCPGDNLYKTKWAALIDLHGANERQQMAAYLHYGPAVVIVDASKAWQFYNGTGVIRSRSCSTKTNHAVLLTGYDFASSTNPYYIIKNSWGTTWGNNGYVHVQAGTNACGVAMYVTVTCTAECEAMKSKTDPLCKVNSVGCASSADVPASCKPTEPPTTKAPTTTPQPTTTEKPTTTPEPTTTNRPTTTPEPTTTSKPTTTTEQTTTTTTTATTTTTTTPKPSPPTAAPHTIPPAYVPQPTAPPPYVPPPTAAPPYIPPPTAAPPYVPPPTAHRPFVPMLYSRTPPVTSPTVPSPYVPPSYVPAAFG